VSKSQPTNTHKEEAVYGVVAGRASKRFFGPNLGQKMVYTPVADEIWYEIVN
jgi:hypothetical protein